MEIIYVLGTIFGMLRMINMLSTESRPCMNK